MVHQFSWVIKPNFLQIVKPTMLAIGAIAFGKRRSMMRFNAFIQQTLSHNGDSETISTSILTFPRIRPSLIGVISDSKNVSELVRRSMSLQRPRHGRIFTRMPNALRFFTSKQRQNATHVLVCAYGIIKCQYHVVTMMRTA